MSLKKLPKIEAVQGPRWQMREDALEKWNPAISAETGENTISILDVIGEDYGSGVSARRIGAALRSIGENDVVVNINSPGGDFFEGVAIYNMLRAHPAKVTVRVMALAASAASVIAMAGDEIQIGRAGFMMIHNSWGICVGNRQDLREMAAAMDTFDAAMASVYAERSGRDQEEISALMDAETWFNGETAVETGLAGGLLPDDAIIEDEETNPKAMKAQTVLENALRAQNPDLSRTERRALLADAKTIMPSADEDGTPSAAETTSFALEMITALRA